MTHAWSTSGFAVVVVWLAILPASACAAEPGPPPGIPPAPTTSEIAQRRAAEQAADSSRTSAWQKAVDEADAPHPGELVEPRALAAVIGTAWFLLAARSQWRSRRRARS